MCSCCEIALQVRCTGQLKYHEYHFYSAESRVVALSCQKWVYFTFSECFLSGCVLSDSPPHTHTHPHPKTCSRDVEAQVNVITSEVWLFLARKSQPNSSQPTIWLSSASSNLRMQMKSLTELRRLNRKEPKLHNYKSLSSGTLSP